MRNQPNNKNPQPKNDPQIPQPDLLFATKQDSEATKKGAGAQQEPTQKILRFALDTATLAEPLYHHQKHAN